LKPTTITARALCPWAVLAGLTIAWPAAAQAPSAAEAPSTAQAPAAIASAEALFRTGKELRDSGQLAQACSSFQRSQQIATGIGVTLYLADCLERLGQLANAYREFRYAESLALSRHDERVEVARARITRLESRVGRLVFDGLPTSVSGWRLEVDGAALPPELWHEDLVVEPGDHRVTFSALGGAPSQQIARVGAGTRVGLRLAASVEPAPAHAQEAAPPRKDGQRWLVYGLLGLGGVSVATGAALLAVKNDSWSDGTDTSGPHVDPVAAAASKIAFGVGGAAVAAAVVVYLVGPRESNAALLVTPAPLVGGGAAIVRGSF
jgi:hypothetical protein